MFETTLRAESQRRLAEIGVADILVGIPTFRNGRTIAPVAQNVAQGLVKYFPGRRPVIAVVDSGSSDDTVLNAQAAPLPPVVPRLVTTYPGIQGKGAAVRTIFDISRALGARVCVVVEADILTLTPEWIQRLVAPVLAREYAYVIPSYGRALADSAVTDLLAYPLTRLLYGVDVRQPMGGDFAMAPELVARLAARDVWETDVARHGVDIWLTTVAINDGEKLCQVHLGPKVGERGELPLTFDPTFVQSVGTLFRMMAIYRRKWPTMGPPRPAPIYDDAKIRAPNADARAGSRDSDRVNNPRGSTNIMLDALAEAFQNGARRYRRLWRLMMSPSCFAAVQELVNRPNGAYKLSAELWAQIVFDFAVVYNLGEGDPDKVVAALLPLYFARLATLLKDSGGKPDVVEKLVQAQAQVFVAHKPYLVHRWQTYVPWEGDGVR
jgi:glycosyltransferase involved in cell wall biosynthesis